MTAPPITAATPEEQTSYLHSLRSYASQSVSVTIHQAVLERWSRCAEAQKAEIERLTAENAAKAIELKAANSKIERMRKAAEGTDQWANEVIAAICKHVGVDDADDGFTAADLASLLEEHNAEFDAIGARATQAEAALAAVTAERDASRERERKLREAGQPVAALPAKEATDER